MTSENVEPMSPELRALLRRGAAPVDAPRDAQERVYGRLASVLPLTPGGGGGSGSGGSEHGPSGGSGVSPPSSLAPQAGSPAAGGSALAKGATGLLSAKIVAPVAISFLLGGGLGAAITLATTKDRIVYVDRPIVPSV